MKIPNGVEARLWGPAIWKALYYVVLGYPIHPSEIQKQKYKEFFLLLKYTLPCTICQKHFVENLQKMPITDDVLSSKEKLFKWLVDYNNVVNLMQGKPKLTYNQVINSLLVDNKTKITKKSTKKNNYIITISYNLIIIMIVLLSIAIIYKNN